MQPDCHPPHRCCIWTSALIALLLLAPAASVRLPSRFMIQQTLLPDEPRPSSRALTFQRHLTSLPRHPGQHEPRHLQDGLRTIPELQTGPRLPAQPQRDSLRASELTNSQVVYAEQSEGLNQPQHASIGHHLIAEAEDGGNEVMPTESISIGHHLIAQTDEGGGEVIHGEHRHLASAGPVQPEAGIQPAVTQEPNNHEAAHAYEQTSNAEPIRLVACAQLKNEVPYVVEWIEFHRLVGFSHLVIYDDFSEDSVSLLETLYRCDSKSAVTVCSDLQAKTINEIPSGFNMHALLRNAAAHFSCLQFNMAGFPAIALCCLFCRSWTITFVGTQPGCSSCHRL